MYYGIDLFTFCVLGRLKKKKTKNTRQFSRKTDIYSYVLIPTKQTMLNPPVIKTSLFYTVIIIVIDTLTGDPLVIFKVKW